MPKLKVISSIQKLEEVVHSCDKCSRELGDSFVEPQAPKSREGDLVTFGCQYQHTKKYRAGFSVRRDDYAFLEEKMAEFISEVKQTPQALSNLAYQDLCKKAAAIIERVRTYGFFTDGEMNFDGFCEYCFTAVPMQIKDYKLLISCSPCASLIADSCS